MVDIIISNGIRTLLSNGLHSIRLVVFKGYSIKFLLGEDSASIWLTPTHKQVTLRLIRYSFKLYFCVAKRVDSFIPVMNGIKQKSKRGTQKNTHKRYRTRECFDVK